MPGRPCSPLLCVTDKQPDAAASPFSLQSLALIISNKNPVTLFYDLLISLLFVWFIEYKKLIKKNTISQIYKLHKTRTASEKCLMMVSILEMLTQPNFKST